MLVYLQFSCLSQLLDVLALCQVCLAILVTVKFLQKTRTNYDIATKCGNTTVFHRCLPDAQSKIRL